MPAKKTTRAKTRPAGRALASREVTREILLSFWKVHVLHHAAEGGVAGQWMLHELRHHGYEVSPGTLYPLLKRMERRGWLRSEVDPRGGKRARRDYHLTKLGAEVLALSLERLRELSREAVGAGPRRIRSVKP